MGGAHPSLVREDELGGTGEGRQALLPLVACANELALVHVILPAIRVVIATDLLPTASGGDATRRRELLEQEPRPLNEMSLAAAMAGARVLAASDETPEIRELVQEQETNLCRADGLTLERFHLGEQVWLRSLAV
jgi:hypothetical protein